MTNQERARRAKGFFLATLLRHCRARLTVIVFLVLLRQGLLLLSIFPMLFAFQIAVFKYNAKCFANWLTSVSIACFVDSREHLLCRVSLPSDRKLCLCVSAKKYATFNGTLFFLCFLFFKGIYIQHSSINLSLKD